jgi:SM-20-related protein
MQTIEKSAATDAGQDVIVKIQLSGGHNHTLALKSDTPLLRSLLGSILGRVQNAGNRTLFQIPTEAGRAALCFSSDDLVCVQTEPPVYVRPNEEESQNGISLENNG